MSAPYAKITDDVLTTLNQQARDAHCAAPLCRPFRADILLNMVCELQAWRRYNRHYTYDADTDSVVLKEDRHDE